MQPENALASMDFTVSGISTSVTEASPEKASSDSTVNSAGKTIFEALADSAAGSATTDNSMARQMNFASVLRIENTPLKISPSYHFMS